MCSGIAKLWCFWLNRIGYFFSLSYMHMHDMPEKKKKYTKNIIAKRIKMLLNMVASVFLGNVGVIGCTSKVIVPINQLWLCVSLFNFLMSQIFIIWDTCALLLCFIHDTQILCYFWYMCKYNVIYPLKRIHVLIYAH